MGPQGCSMTPRNGRLPGNTILRLSHTMLHGLLHARSMLCGLLHAHSMLCGSLHAHAMFLFSTKTNRPSCAYTVHTRGGIKSPTQSMSSMLIPP